MTRINGKSWRIKKLEKFFNRFPPLSRWNPPLLIFDSQENQYQYEICFCSILLLRGLIRSKASWKVCRVCNHNIYRSQTSLASKYFSPNEIQRSPVKRSCYSLGWQRAYEKLKLLNRGRRYLSRTKEYNMMDNSKIIIYFSLKRNNILSWFLSWSYHFFDGMRISNENMFTYKQNFYNLITIRLFQMFSFVADITILSLYDDDKTYFYSYFYSYW